MECFISPSRRSFVPAAATIEVGVGSARSPAAKMVNTVAEVMLEDMFVATKVCMHAIGNKTLFQMTLFTQKVALCPMARTLVIHRVMSKHQFPGGLGC
mmetsp:Transcript_10456/g.19169  ORF Transcript_10456/g.19169 Transcript_10456/m.19169 type:complete len:98 (-) Transcript_10456:956-1249(-)